ncbi:helix-turn-helix transcriptional regulator [Pseudomonas sp. R2.Fl]|nr:helix-turn-helix transcriptional regulator [Pseudomonas sp. R2.Fl]
MFVYAGPFPLRSHVPMESQFLPALGLLTTCLCVLMAVFLWFTPGSLARANRYLAGFLLLTAVDVVGWASPLLPDRLLALLPWRTPLAFLQMPLLHAYVVALCFPARRTRGHLLAGALTLLIALAAHAGVLALATGDAAFLVFRRIESALLHLQYYAYMALMAGVLLAYRRAYRDYCSNPDSATFAWLVTLLSVSLLASTFVLLKSLAWWSGQVALYRMLDPLVAALAALITAALTLTALTRQHLFLGVVTEADTASPKETASPADATSPPVDTDAACPDRAQAPPAHQPAALARLDAFMAEHEPFLDPSLTIRSLSRRLGWGQRELSQLLNQALGMHFFDFVNRYRVQKASVLLRDPALGDLTVLEIAHRSGFNTKSSFNTAFHRHQGTTPSAYRRRDDAGARPGRDTLSRADG